MTIDRPTLARILSGPAGAPGPKLDIIRRGLETNDDGAAYTGLRRVLRDFVTEICSDRYGWEGDQYGVHVPFYVALMVGTKLGIVETRRQAAALVRRPNTPEGGGSPLADAYYEVRAGLLADELQLTAPARQLLRSGVELAERRLRQAAAVLRHIDDPNHTWETGKQAGALALLGRHELAHRVAGLHDPMRVDRYAISAIGPTWRALWDWDRALVHTARVLETAEWLPAMNARAAVLMDRVHFLGTGELGEALQLAVRSFARHQTEHSARTLARAAKMADHRQLLQRAVGWLEAHARQAA